MKNFKQVDVISSDKTESHDIPRFNNWIRQRTVSAVYVHFLSNSAAYILFKTELYKKKLFWILWGADFYGLSKFSNLAYKPLSKSFAWQNNSWKKKIIRFLGLPSEKHVWKIFEHIDYYVGFKEEYDFVQSKINAPMKFINREFYFNKEELNFGPIQLGSGSILIGNSDDPMNNHLDVLNKIAPVIGKENKLIIPINGIEPKYKNAIVEKLMEMDASFILLEDYMEVDKFFELMQEVSFVIYGHLRQQGMGTLLPLLYAGKKLWLWEENYSQLIYKRWGIQIHSLDKISKEDLQVPSLDEAEKQRQSMEKYTSVNGDHNRWKEILEL